jgi:hypothetical protein
VSEAAAALVRSTEGLDVRRLRQWAGRLFAARGTWDAHWRQCAQYVMPQWDQFESYIEPGNQRQRRVWDASAALALPKYAAAMEALVCPRNTRWHSLKTRDPSLMDIHEVKVWVESIVDLLFEFRYRPGAGFETMAQETLLQLGVFGTAPVYLDERPGLGWRYRACHLSTVAIDQSESGLVDVVVRKLRLDARQAAQRFGKEALPAKVRAALEAGREEKHEYLHMVAPWGDLGAPNRPGAGAWRWGSVYLCNEDDDTVISTGGYRQTPWSVPRASTAPEEVYGRSPTMQVLADIDMLQEMRKTTVRGTQRRAAPPLLLHEDVGLAGFSVACDSLNYGALAEDGTPLVRALDLGGDVQLNEQVAESARSVVQDAFGLTLFQILVDAPAMTATEVLQRAQEKGQLLAPVAGRLQSEWLSPLIRREIDLLLWMGMIPPIPQVLLEAGGSAATIEIDYSSPADLLARSGEALGIMRTFEALSPLAAGAAPDILDLFDSDAAARVIADVNGVPAKVLRSAQDMEQLRAGRAQAQQAQEALAAAPALAGGVKDLAQAAASVMPEQAPPGATPTPPVAGVAA